MGVEGAFSSEITIEEITASKNGNVCTFTCTAHGLFPVLSLPLLKCSYLWTAADHVSTASCWRRARGGCMCYVCYVNTVCPAHPWTMSSGRQCSPSCCTVLRLGPASVWQLIVKDSTRSYADASDCDTVTTTFRRWRKCLRVLIGLCLAESYETTGMRYSITCQNVTNWSITWDHGSTTSNYLQRRLNWTTVTILCGCCIKTHIEMTHAQIPCFNDTVKFMFIVQTAMYHYDMYVKVAYDKLR